MAEQTIETMRQELGLEGYRIEEINDTRIGIIITAPNWWKYEKYLAGSSDLEEGRQWNYKMGIQYAHKHLLATRRAAEMEAFVRELATFPRTSDAYNQFYKFQEKAKALLGKE